VNVDDVSRRPDASSRASSWLPWLAAAVLVAGIAVSLATFLDGRNTSEPSSAPSTAIQRTAGEKTVPLDPAASIVAKKFILTAVARRNLGEAYDLVGPALRQGLTRVEWERGNIPVVPYPASPVQATPTKVAYSFGSRALLEVTLHPRKGAKVGPQLFYLELSATGKGKQRHWVVSNWVPGSAPSIPQTG
jgi:hypothetical protein